MSLNQQGFIGWHKNHKKKYNNIYLQNTSIHSIMFGYFCIRFIDFMLTGEKLLECKNLFSLNDYEKNDKK